MVEVQHAKKRTIEALVRRCSFDLAPAFILKQMRETGSAVKGKIYREEEDVWPAFVAIG